MVGCETPRLVFSPLCHPSARFVVRGPTLSTWLHNVGVKAPVIHVLSTYAAKIIVLPSTSGSPVDGGCCSRCHINGMAKTGNILMAIGHEDVAIGHDAT